MPCPTVVRVLVLLLVIQQVENNVLARRISGNAVRLHPLGAMFALLAGFKLAGLLDGLFAVRLAGVGLWHAPSTLQSARTGSGDMDTSMWSAAWLSPAHRRRSLPPGRVVFRVSAVLPGPVQSKSVADGDHDGVEQAAAATRCPGQKYL